MSLASTSEHHELNYTGILMTVCALLNGMIGGTILILPVIAISTGYLTILLVSIFMGFISYYSANLIVIHLGKAKNMKQSILNHFSLNHAYLVAYSAIIWSGQIPALMLYFNLICLQIQGLIGQHVWIGYAVAAALIIQTFIIVYYDVVEEAMGIGIVSIASYIIFVGWALATAPSGNNQIAPLGNPYHLAQLLFVAYSVHDIIVQNIIKNPKRENYHSIVVATFAIATLAYTFVAAGSFALINRTPYKKNPQTIEDYFQIGSIEVSLIELLYFLHLFTVFPQYLRVSKIRAFDAFKIQNEKQLQWKQGLYLSTIILICLAINIMQIKLDVLISIISALSGSFLIVIIPTFIHIKCVYYDRNCGSIQNQQNIDNQQEQINIINTTSSCQCQYTFTSKTTKYLQLVFLIVLFLFGFAAFLASLRDTFMPTSQ